MISVFPEGRQDTAFLVENSRANETHLAINLILKSAYRRHLRLGFRVRRLQLQRWVSSRNLGHGFRKGAHESSGQWLGQHAQIIRMMPVAIHIIHGHRGSLEESRRKSLKSLHILLKNAATDGIRRMRVAWAGKIRSSQTGLDRSGGI